MVRLSCWFHGLRDSLFGLSAFSLLLVLFLASISSALAQVPGHTAPPYYADQGAAFAACYADREAKAYQYFPGQQGPCQEEGIVNHIGHNDRTVRWRITYSTMNAIFQGSYPEGVTCDTRPSRSDWFADDDPLTSDDVCDNGCYMELVFVVGGGTGQNSWSPTGATCTTTDAPAPIPDTDGDGVPDDDDAFPDDPSESSDSDGDGQGDNSDFAPDDPTNGDDDGNGNESDNSASGGGTCAAPPACAGDGIACATLYQQWQTRCAIERLSEELASGNGGTGQEPGDDDETTDWGAGDGSKPSWQEVNVNSTMFDTSGFMGGGSCPTWGPVEILGVSYPLPQVHCSILSWIGYLVVAVAFVIAARIIAG